MRYKNLLRAKPHNQDAHFIIRDWSTCSSSGWIPIKIIRKIEKSHTTQDRQLGRLSLRMVLVCIPNQNFHFIRIPIVLQLKKAQYKINMQGMMKKFLFHIVFQLVLKTYWTMSRIIPERIVGNWPPFHAKRSKSFPIIYIVGFYIEAVFSRFHQPVDL